MTPQQQAEEWGLKYIQDAQGDICPCDDCIEGLDQAFLAGHAAGIQAERERIWAEIDNNWQGTSWRMLVKRIIFGEQP